MVQETELFHKIFTVFRHEIDQIENTRGKLNDFQLMQAVLLAKDTMGVVGWDSRQTVSSIFEKYMHIYRTFGREKADEWVTITFEYSVSTSEYEGINSTLGRPDTEDGYTVGEEEGILTNKTSRIDELSHLIVEKETDLLQLYRELFLLQQGS
ncbi:hypothetical protein GT003_15785 [Paenibacillus sacheonensis]|uniref:Uncharacterized protein n=2 Tax=Paenibacillus sacheonensis TaxID=742054 RepID=A0A7X4YQ21_9BACL|nr:hypothetical protein [Paenibacillus sacheonensis]NBC70462.1 hypothetical protein [Paenibacillus sacheonensis]